jgi:hypothetical protein
MSQRNMLLWILVPVGVAAVWALGLLGPSDQGSVAATADDEPMATDVQAPAKPADPINANEPPPPVPAAAPQAPPAQPAAPVAEPELPGVAEPAPDGPNPSELFSAAFLDEERDAVWAPEAESRVHAAFAKANVPLGSLLAVQCRATLCKIDMLFDRRHHLAFAVASRELRSGFFAEDISLDRQSAPTDKGPERMTAYILRKGNTVKDYE